MSFLENGIGRFLEDGVMGRYSILWNQCDPWNVMFVMSEEPYCLIMILNVPYNLSSTFTKSTQMQRRMYVKPGLGLIPSDLWTLMGLQWQFDPSNSYYQSELTSRWAKVHCWVLDRLVNKNVTTDRQYGGLNDINLIIKTQNTNYKRCLMYICKFIYVLIYTLLLSQ